jgi:hypothetical protein
LGLNPPDVDPRWKAGNGTITFQVLVACQSRAAFAEKRRPNWKGWDDPQDRYRLPTLDSVKG